MVRLYGLLRVLVTALVFGLLLAAVYALWIRYQVEP
jgi:hypothetical protein